MNYGFTPDSQQADTTNTNIPVTAAGESQTSNNQVGKYNVHLNDFMESYTI